MTAVLTVLIVAGIVWAAWQDRVEILDNWQQLARELGL